MNTIKFNHLLIEEKNENSYYITLGDWVIYIDASIEGEKIISHWIDPECKNESNFMAKIINNTYKSSVIEY
jgi:hypothetical protein